MLQDWATEQYNKFVRTLFDALPDFPNCCYQISGAVALLAHDTPLLKDVRVVYGSYDYGGVPMPHGWVRATTGSGASVILDFAHLQFEPDKLHAGCYSYHQLVEEALADGTPVPGEVLFLPEDSEYPKYNEMQ